MLLNNIIVLLFHLSLVILICWMGWQDWKTREVSNTLSIPLAAFGTFGLLFRLYAGEPSAQTSLIVVLVLTSVALRGWMGGADWKVQMGLWGLWPLGGIAALIGGGAWGAIAMIRTHDKNVSFPGISAFAIAILLTFVAEVSIISFS